MPRFIIPGLPHNRLRMKKNIRPHVPFQQRATTGLEICGFTQSPAQKFSTEWEDWPWELTAEAASRLFFLFKKSLVPSALPLNHRPVHECSFFFLSLTVLCRRWEDEQQQQQQSNPSCRHRASPRWTIVCAARVSFLKCSLVAAWPPMRCCGILWRVPQSSAVLIDGHHSCVKVPVDAQAHKWKQRWKLTCSAACFRWMV